MSYSYLSEDNFKESWEDSKSYMAAPFDPLAEFERLAKNRPHPSINPAFGKNTDGTLAGIIQETPKRIIQQLPSGNIKSNDRLTKVVIEWKLRNQIIPYANAQATALQKSWSALSKSMTFGAQPSMTYLADHNGYRSGDFELPYVKDVFMEKGKLSFNSCNKIFVRSWYQCSDIEGIIDREKNLKARAKKRGEEYESTWDLTELRKLVKEAKDQKKKDDEKSITEKERNIESGGIEIIHGFQNGVGAKFYSYATATEKIVRTKVNPDKRGIMPLQYLYKEVTLDNPLGKGVCELSGGMQNFIDSSVQAYQYMQGIMLDPPLKIRGDVVDSSLKYKYGAKWRMGSNPNSDVEPVNINTTAMSNFSTIYGLSKSQILNLNSANDTSISSTVGNPGFSKTDAGVSALQSRLGVSDNYLRKQYEDWFQEVCESMINIEFGEKTGIEQIEVDEDTAKKIRDIDPELISEDNIFNLDYSLFNEALHFEVDASSSDKQDDQKQIEGLDGLLERISGSPILQQIYSMYPEKQVGLLNSIIAASGVEDVEKLQIDADDFKKKLEEQQMQAQADAQTQSMQDPMTDPEMTVDPEQYEPMPEPLLEEEPQQPLGEEELMFASELQDRGVPDEDIEKAIIMIREGYPQEDVLDIIGQSMGVVA